LLRQLLNEPKRIEQGDLLKALQALEQYRAKLGRIGPGGHPSRTQNGGAIPRLELWTRGFADALDELEESKHCAELFGRRVKAHYVEDMREEERENYRRYLYFYKNAFIRVFSVLDKLGYFLDELYMLGTGRVKSRFSYFTVLRQMHQRKIEAQLEERLFEMKKQYQDPLRRLRSQRNMEIHLLNAEMVDDMLLAKNSAHPDGRQKVENLHQNLSDLTLGFEMVCRAVTTVFIHAKSSAR
jgi:hypothetical protein